MPIFIISIVVALAILGLSFVGYYQLENFMGFVYGQGEN
jgi:hypothetical protein